MTITLLIYSLKLNFLIFTTGLRSSLISFLRTYTVSNRNALDRLRVRFKHYLVTVCDYYTACPLIGSVQFNSVMSLCSARGFTNVPILHTHIRCTSVAKYNRTCNLRNACSSGVNTDKACLLFLPCAAQTHRL